MRSPMVDTQLVLQGSLGETSLDELLSSLSLSRSCLRVEVDPGDGSIVVKSGNVLTAAAGAEGPAGRSAFEALRRRKNGSFRVYRQPYAEWRTEPIGSLSELMGTPIADRVEDLRELVLSGIADEDALKDVLGMMGLSRRRLELRMRREDGTEAIVLAKAGLVCEARIEPSGLSGREALLDMRRVGVVSFELYHLRTTDRLPRPFGSLVELVRDRRRRGGTVRDRDHHSVIRGRFEDHGFLDVLSIVSASRQVLEIHLTRRRAWRGTVVVKSSQLLSASCDTGEHGIEALLALLAEPGDAFDAVLANRTTLPESPLGDLRQITATAAQGEQPRAAPEAPDPLGGFPDPSLVPTPRPAMPRVPRPTAATATPTPAPQDVPQAPLAEPAVDLAPLEEGLERLQQQLARQEALLQRAAEPVQQRSPGTGLLAGVLVTQVIVAGLLVAIVAMLAIG